jgi:hypothetical protein
MKISGGCHCGAVTFSAEIEPANVVACHCTDCQVLSGSPFRVVVPAPIEGFTFQGEVRNYVKVADSGNRRAQVFCPACATPLFGAAPENPTFVTIRLGCVDQRAELGPARQIWTHSAMPWLDGLDSLPSKAQG